MIIRSPSTQKGVEVTTENELRTSGVSFSISHYEADTYQNVYLLTHKIAAPDSNLNPIIWLVNTNTDTDYNLVTCKIDISAEANAEWECYTGTTWSSGGGSLTPVNSSTFSSQTLNATIYGSSTGNFISLGGSKYYLNRTVTSAWNSKAIDLGQSILLGYNTSFGISCKTTSAANIYISMLLINHRIHI